MFEDGYAEVNGVRLHYVSAGEGDLILFLHGFPEFWYTWRDYLRAFAPEYRAVALDLRGYNRSAKPKGVGAYRADRIARDVRDLVKHLGYTTCTLVAHDWGGGIAWTTAILFPKVVSRLVIVNAPHPALLIRELRRNPAQQRASAYMRVLQEKSAEDMLAANDYQALADTTFIPPEAFTDEDRAAYRAAWAQPGALTAGLNYYRASKVGPPRTVSERLYLWIAGKVAARRVRVPTLIIWGERDPYLLPDNLVGVERFVPDVRIERIAEGTHWVIREKQEQMIARIRAFVTTGE